MMRSKLGTWLRALVCTVLVGCLASVDTNGNLHLPAVDSYDLWIESSVDPQNTAAVLAGAQQWTTYTDVKIALHYGTHVCIEDGCFIVIQVPQKTLDAVVGENYIGWTVPYLITLTPASTWDEALDTATHEVGHALGLWHPCTSPCSDYALMNPTYGSGADHVSCADVETFFSERCRPVPSTVTPCTDAPGPLVLP